MGASVAALLRRRLETLRLLRLKLSGDPAAPHLILKPWLQVRLLGARLDIEPDTLVASTADPFYTVVEIKNYPDRGGKTDAEDVRGACRQAAVGVVALRQVLEGSWA